MVKQDVKRNGRGQIVSYELNPVLYDEVLLSNVNFQNVEKYNRLSFEQNVNFKIVEFANSDILIDPMVDLGFVLEGPTETSRQSLRSPQPPPAGQSGTPSPGRTNLPGGGPGSGGLGGSPGSSDGRPRTN